MHTTFLLLGLHQHPDTLSQAGILSIYKYRNAATLSGLGGPIFTSTYPFKSVYFLLDLDISIRLVDHVIYVIMTRTVKLA